MQCAPTSRYWIRSDALSDRLHLSKRCADLSRDTRSDTFWGIFRQVVFVKDVQGVPKKMLPSDFVVLASSLFLYVTAFLWSTLQILIIKTHLSNTIRLLWQLSKPNCYVTFFGTHCKISRYLIRCTADLICETDRGRRSRCSAWPMHFVTRKYAQIFTTLISRHGFLEYHWICYLKSLGSTIFCMRYNKMKNYIFYLCLFSSIPIYIFIYTINNCGVQCTAMWCLCGR